MSLSDFPLTGGIGKLVEGGPEITGVLLSSAFPQAKLLANNKQERTVITKRTRASLIVFVGVTGARGLFNCFRW
jgi:hypothetical protein